MKGNRTTNLLLLVIAAALIAIAIRPLLAPAPAQASSTGFYPVYIEPGVQMLRSPKGAEQVYGKVVVDLTNGKIWGFPTLTTATYPIDVGSRKPPVSHPMFLGTFAFEDMTQQTAAAAE